MKLPHRLALLLTLAGATNLALGQDGAPPAPSELPTFKQIVTPGGSNVVFVGAGNSNQAPSANGVPAMVTVNVAPKLVKATYLGVYVTPAGATLQAQLKLPQGIGLIVSGLDADSPAKSGGLHENDVLYKLDDQFVINPAQFEVLVRMHKPGDKVEMTVIREAQPMKLTATLTEKDLPELSWATSQFSGATGSSREFTLFLNQAFGTSAKDATGRPILTPAPIVIQRGMTSPATEPARQKP